MLLARSDQSDPIDGLASNGDDILTSDPGDLLGLAEAVGLRVELIPV